MSSIRPHLCATATLLMLAACGIPATVHAQVSGDLTTPTIALNQEAKDVTTKLELLRQDLYIAQQEITLLSLRGYEDHMAVKRVLFPSGKEIVPGYIFTPRQIDRNKRYPGLVIVHGAFHGHLD